MGPTAEFCLTISDRPRGIQRVGVGGRLDTLSVCQRSVIVVNIQDRSLLREKTQLSWSENESNFFDSGSRRLTLA